MLELDHDLLSLLPPWYREILDYQAICKTEEERLEALAAEITAVRVNFFFQTMGEGAVSLWEQIFKISPNLLKETLAFRRERLLNRISSRPPFTLQFLREKLNSLIGPGRWTLSVDYPNYTIYVESAAQNQSYAIEVSTTIGKIKPAHIVYLNRSMLQAGLLVSEGINKAVWTHNYKLGAWQLGLMPFITKGEEEAVKMANIPSIQPALLEGTAAFVSGDVASARINGATVISAITKSVIGSTLTVDYAVTAGQTGEITQAELLDASGTPLTVSNIYVPVKDRVVMKHVIKIAEGALE